jgi:S1-C subfamily serine protease
MRMTLSYVAVAVLAAAAGYTAAQVAHPRQPPAAAPADSPPAAAPAESPSAPRAQQPTATPTAAPASPPPAETPRPPAAGPAPEAEASDLSPEEAVNVQIYQSVNRSVVNITTSSEQTDDFWMMSSTRQGSGSGGVLDKQGHVVTNYHVIEDAGEVAVTLFDSSSHEAKVVGVDPNNDLAVLKINAPPDKLFPIVWGNSARLQVGMRVLAIGNPFGLERTMTTGIVSSLNRSLRSENDRLIRGVIQTDAAINPGNSGGPLLNRRGEMVGITTAIVGRSGQSSGIGLAIPSATARRLVDILIHYGRVIRPDCGIFSVVELDQGLLISRLVPNGPAQRAGLRGPRVSVVRRNGFEYRTVDRSRADLIVAVDGHRVRTLDDLLSYIEESKKAGDRIVLSVIRDGRRLDVPVVLSEERG